MKKIIQIFLSVTIFIGFYACNSGGEKKPGEINKDSTKDTTPTATTPSNDCDYYVDRATSKLMIEKYNSTFDKPGLTKEFWIEACVLKAIDNFFNDSNNASYDGVRFFLGGKKVLLSTKSVLMITPTTPVASATPFEKHTNQWGVDIPLTSCIPPDQLLMNVSYADAIDKINLFGSKFRDESIEGQRNTAKNDPLSVGVWISRCKLKRLMELYTPANNLDGLMAIAAAYYQDDERRRHGERKYIVQSTLIFVPTINGAPDWNIVKPPVGWKDTGGFNHGSLCPQICD